MRRSPRSPKELAALALLAVAALLCLIFTLVGALTPDKQTGLLAAQHAFLGLGPLLGTLGAMAMTWRRNRNKPAVGLLVLASVLWLIGATLSGFGLYTAFTPGDSSVLTNLGYSVALCLTPGAFFSLMGLGTFWYSQRGKAPAGAEPAVETRAAAVQVEAAPGYEELRGRAAEYRRRINDLIREKNRAAFAGQLRPITEKLGNWEQQINHLVDRLSAFDADAVIQRDLNEVPLRIRELEGQVSAEPDPQVRREMAETLDGHRTHRAQLEELVNTMRRTRLQLDQTLSAMGTIYSQVQMLQALEIDGDRARRIAGDIDEQVNGLADLLSAMLDVYSGPAGTGEAQADDGRAGQIGSRPDHLPAASASQEGR